MRAISNLETPPADRLAVETRVTRFSDDLIRHAILRELNRGGQIYFVHNRVHDIEAVAARLNRIVPEARIDIGHGQMPEHELEDVMLKFVRGETDILLSTTIVESGLDIPNANTIFIDEADRYGLADLHQLRGRVGRYKHRAYCYLLVDENRHLSPEAARRLRAIEEFSEMGAGFALAMRDLEIRGAGNILGTQQSGHIAMVGYELYCALLEQAVRDLKKLPPRDTIDVNIDLPGEAYLPRGYVPDMRTKIDLYRRLARLTTEDGGGRFRGGAGRPLRAAAGSGRAFAGASTAADLGSRLGSARNSAGRSLCRAGLHVARQAGATGEAVGRRLRVADARECVSPAGLRAWTMRRRSSRRSKRSCSRQDKPPRIRRFLLADCERSQRSEQAAPANAPTTSIS